MSDFKSDYTTMKSSMCRFQKCKKINLEKLLLVARFLIRGHNYQTMLFDNLKKLINYQFDQC